MYHLFNRIYLDHEKRYHTNHDFTLVYEKEGAHPISRQSSFPFPAVPSFRSYLKEKFNGSEEDFWKDLIMKPSTKKYFLFVDSNLLLNLKLQFWKSIFENLEAENAYKLYKFDCMDSTLKRFMYRNRVGSFYDSSNEERIDYEEFKSRFEKTVTIKCLSEMDKSEVSFEYLLGDYFFNKNSQYSFAFRSKLKDLSWKIWFNDMEILKSELINSFYDINRVVPSFQFSLDDFSNLENMIIGHPQLKWMLDPEFHDENIDYVKNNYDPDLFIQLAKSFRDLWDLKILSNDPEILSKVQIQDKILPTEKLFKEQYFELLEENVEKKYGLSFVDEYLRDKANQILPSFIYEKIRNGSTEELQFLMLKRGLISHFSKDFNVIYLRVVQGCNLNCAHCFTLGNKDPYKLLDHSTAKKFLGTIKNKINPKSATVYIHGGETFSPLFSHLEKINEIVHSELNETKVNIIPQTNLMYQIDDKFVQFVKTHYNNQIGVSWDYGIRFDSASSKLNEDLFFKNFRYLVDNGIDIAVAITVQKHLLECEIEKVLPLFNGATSLDFEFLTMFDKKTIDLKVKNHEWAKFYERIVDYYVKNDTTWSLPQVDLFTKSFLENKIFNCKCNCCQHRTFTLNCNGTLGLCPDETYIRPISDIEEFHNDWDSFELKARESHLRLLTQDLHPMCQSCEFFDVCGGNCELSLFDEEGLDCPLSKNVLKFQQDNLGLFKTKLNLAMTRLIELKN